jgi:eukaryotic-like serine/threonine-protein kinase
MKPERWQKIDEIFHAALQCKPEERKAFIDEACRDDEDLRRELESLLAEESGADNFIEEPAMEVVAMDLADDRREALIAKNIGPYKIISRLGAGGMGEVYRAEDSHLKRHVAVKVLGSRFANDRALMARFEREAYLLASLNHPNIAAIYGLEESNGVQALVIELVEGPTLAERIAAGPIPLDEALPIALPMVEALEYSHEKGVIHRDLKPANVKLTHEGIVKVLDFGLAKALEDGSTKSDLEKSPTVTVTESGSVLGTAAYMSPEQAGGLPVDKRADIWSFGVVFYEMLTGKRLYAGATTSDTLAALLKLEPDWNALPSEVPPRIRRLLHRCLTKDRRERLQAIGEARIEIAGYLADPTEAGGQPSAGIGVSQKLLLAGLALTLIISLLAVIWQLKREGAQPTPLRLEVTLSRDQPLPLLLGTAVALSPDGRRLAYFTGRYASRRLYLRSLDRFEGEELVSIEWGTNPFFSPDGNWVGFATPTDLKKYR